jgi:hypothetical protein|nr:MAG TPA: asparaginyl-tRNA synthetase [Caudoviricetes sp.]
MSKKILENNRLFSQQPLLSDDGGNLLEWREDGLYYGQAAPRNISTLYVHANEGKDANPGTINKPLRTINAALNQYKQGQQYNLKLYEGLTYPIHSKAHDGSGHAYENLWVTFEPYGPKLDQTFRKNHYGTANWARSTDFPRPTVKLLPYIGSNGLQRITVFGTLKGWWNGIIIDAAFETNAELFGTQRGFIGGRDNYFELVFTGSQFILGKHPLLMTGTENSSLVLDAGNILNPGANKKLLLIYENARLGLIAKGEHSGGPLTARGPDGRTQVTLNMAACLPRNQWKNYMEGIRQPVETNTFHAGGFGF